MRLVRSAAVLLLLAACAKAPDGAPDAQSEQQSALDGVPTNGFPSWAERTVLVLSNRARADPQTELTCDAGQCPDKPCYLPMAPLVYDYNLNRSTRLHSFSRVERFKL